LLDIIDFTDKNFLSLLGSGNKIFEERNASLRLTNYVMNKILNPFSVNKLKNFEPLNEHALGQNPMFESSHIFELIKSVVLRYLQMRMLSHVKVINNANSQSMRNFYTKLVHFMAQ